MKLLAIYLIISTLFIFGVYSSPAETEQHSLPVSGQEFREVPQDGTVTDTRLIAGFAVPPQNVIVSQ
jgi:hypothetical protein